MTLTIEEIAKTKKLLVVSDFDGTIAGFSKDAYNVPINQKSLKAVKDLSQQADTDVVILSGRQPGGPQNGPESAVFYNFYYQFFC